MDIRKLKTGRGGVLVEWVVREGTSGTNEHTHQLTAKDPAHPDLLQALDAFRQPVLALLALPAAWKEFAITGLSASVQKGEARGLIVHGVKTLDSCPRPFNVTTPLLVEADSVDGGEDVLGDFWEALDTVCREAEAYVKGKRAQGELFPPEGEESEEPAAVSS